MHRATVFVTEVTLRQSLTQSLKVTPSSQRFNSIVLVKSIIIFLVFFVKTPSYRGTGVRFGVIVNLDNNRA